MEAVYRLSSESSRTIESLVISLNVGSYRDAIRAYSWSHMICRNHVIPMSCPSFRTVIRSTHNLIGLPVATPDGLWFDTEVASCTAMFIYLFAEIICQQTVNPVLP